MIEIEIVSMFAILCTGIKMLKCKWILHLFSIRKQQQIRWDSWNWNWNGRYVLTRDNVCALSYVLLYCFICWITLSWYFFKKMWSVCKMPAACAQHTDIKTMSQAKVEGNVNKQMTNWNVKRSAYQLPRKREMYMAEKHFYFQLYKINN